MEGCGRTGPAAWFVFGSSPAAVGLFAAEETAWRSPESSEEGNQAGIRRTDHFISSSGIGVRGRVRVFAWWQDADSVEGIGCAGLGKPSSRLAGSGAMIHITAQMRVLVAIEPVDGRKGIDSLVRVCQGQLCEDPMTGCVFVFRSRRGTSIRLLSYDGQGYRLAQKRLSKGRFTWWPESSSAAKQLEAYEAQLLKYLVWAEGRPIACLAWSSAPRHLGSRDRYIGWDAAARRNRIRFIAYNTRFLILPWVRVEHLASHILGRMATRISDDWEQMYGHPLYFLETFIDPERFRGTCYRAANWVLMGRTTGRGKQSNSYVPNRSIKEVLGYPLTKRFRELLGGVE